MEPSPLKAERKRRGWSQSELAEKVGVNITTVSRWEQGRAMPYPYHRNKLVALFGKTPDELGLLPNTDEQRKIASSAVQPETVPQEFVLADLARSETLNSETAPQAFMQGDLAWAEALDNIKSPLESDALLQLSKRHLQPQSLGNIYLGSLNYVLTSRSPNRVRHPFILLSILLVAVLLIIAALPAFHPQPSPRTSQAQDNYGPPTYTLTIPTIDPTLQNTAQHLLQAFNAVYAQLVNRFALDPATAPRNVTLTFSRQISSVAITSSSTLTLNPDWIQQHPTQIGLLTHELTLLLEHYPSGAPSWFADGMADYARSVYGPADDEWSLPNGVQPHESYTQGGTVAARFLRWLEQYTRLDIVDQLNHIIQTKHSFSSSFYILTHHTIDDLWRQYEIYPVIALTPERLYKTVISRKPLYQSSFHIRASDPYFANADQGLSLSNFAMQADITIASGDAYGGFFFRSNEPISCYKVYISTNGLYGLYPGCQTGHHGTYNISPTIKMGFNQTNRLTIIVEKYTIYLYINGQFITEINDTRLASYGALGVTRTIGTNSDIRFDHVQIF